MYSSLKDMHQVRTRPSDMMSPGPRIWTTPNMYVDLLTEMPTYQHPYVPKL
jgi:hypothetical protein